MGHHPEQLAQCELLRGSGEVQYENWKYPLLPMTVDILNRRFVDNDEKEEILEKEKILTNIINVFRTKSFW